MPSQKNPANKPSNTDEQTNAGVDEPRRRRACSSPPLIQSERVRHLLVSVAGVRRGLVNQYLGSSFACRCCWVRRGLVNRHLGSFVCSTVLLGSSVRIGAWVRRQETQVPE
nr:hypothetical protein CFP56_23674 [Quercus suber]